MRGVSHRVFKRSSEWKGNITVAGDCAWRVARLVQAKKAKEVAGSEELLKKSMRQRVLQRKPSKAVDSRRTPTPD